MPPRFLPGTLRPLPLARSYEVIILTLPEFYAGTIDYFLLYHQAIFSSPYVPISSYPQAFATSYDPEYVF